MSMRGLYGGMHGFSREEAISTRDSNSQVTWDLMLRLAYKKYVCRGRQACWVRNAKASNERMQTRVWNEGEPHGQVLVNGK